MKNLFSAIIITFVMTTSCFANDSVQKNQEIQITWQTDMEKAQEQALKSNKLILVDFTGSDWCIWCIRLEEEVFAKPEFQKYGTENFVFLMLDFPSKKKLPEEETKKNKELKEKYGVKGFPTILLLDATGKEVARTGYKRGGPENYIAHLTELIEKYEAEKLIEEKSERK